LFRHSIRKRRRATYGQGLLARLIGITVIALQIAGCGESPLGSISGKITYRNKPVTTGQISFIPTSGQPVTVEIQSDGSYSALRIPPGEAIVTIISQRAGTPDLASQEEKHRKIVKDNDGNEKVVVVSPGVSAWPQPVFVVPELYAHPRSSRLSVTIESGSNVKDFHLK
jgi:hypothetical protein